MPEIPTQQSPSDPRQLPRTLNEDGTWNFAQVGFQELDFGAVFGGKTTSTTENSATVGLKTFTLDWEDGKIQVSYAVQITSLIDPEVFMYGLVTRKDTTNGTAEIDIAVNIVSPLTLEGAYWEIQVIAGPMRGPETNRVAISATTNTIGSGEKTFEIQADKFFPLKASVILTSLTDRTAQMIGKITGYSGTTLDIFVPAEGVYGSGEHSAWFLEVIDIAPVASGAPPTSVVKQAEATSTASSTITLPADIQAGDLIVLFDYYNGGGAGAATAIPSGFTEIRNENSGEVPPSHRAILSYKLASGSEGGTTIAGMVVSTTQAAKIAVVFRPNVPAQLVTVASPVGEMNDANPSSKTITASGGDAPLVVIGCYGTNAGGSGAVNPRTFTVGGAAAKDGETEAAATNLDAWLAWKLYNSSPPDVVIDMDDEASRNVLLGCYIALSASENVPGDIVVWDNDGSGNSALPGSASQTQMEAATATGAFASPANLKHFRGMPKAIYAATVTPTALPGAATSWNTGTEICTWNTNHGLTTGETFIPVTLPPGGVTNLSPYYVNVASATTFSLHLTRADAETGANKVNITSSAATTARKLVVSNEYNYGLKAVGAFGGTPASTTLGFEFNFLTALSAAAGRAEFGGRNIFNTTPLARPVWLQPIPTSLTTALASFSEIRCVSPTEGPGTWANQGLNAFQISFALWADL